MWTYRRQKLRHRRRITPSVIKNKARKVLSPIKYGLERDPPPLPDRPEVEGDAWKEAVQLGHLNGEERTEILNMLAKHRSMWSGRLGQVQSTNHRIDLIPGKKPVQCQPYRAGPRARAVESAEIQRMLKAEVIEPATSEWCRIPESASVCLHVVRCYRLPTFSAMVYYVSSTVDMVRSGHFFLLRFSPSLRRTGNIYDLIFYLVSRLV
jgi:hypothetical protein